jgi:hypothetical protein
MSWFCSPKERLEQGPKASKWGYESAHNICIFAKLVMTYQGTFGEFIFETALLKRLQLCGAVERTIWL